MILKYNFKIRIFRYSYNFYVSYIYDRINSNIVNHLQMHKMCSKYNFRNKSQPADSHVLIGLFGYEKNTCSLGFYVIHILTHTYSCLDKTCTRFMAKVVFLAIIRKAIVLSFIWYMFYVYRWLHFLGMQFSTLYKF